MTASTPSRRTALSVNVNKVALVRNTRHLGIPSVTRAAQLCLAAGAQGITIHPRPDERHIRGTDVFELAALMRDWPQAEFNIEGNPFAPPRPAPGSGAGNPSTSTAWRCARSPPTSRRSPSTR